MFHRKWTDRSQRSVLAMDLYRRAGCVVPEVVDVGDDYIDVAHVEGRKLAQADLAEVCVLLGRIDLELDVTRMSVWIAPFDDPSRIGALASSPAHASLVGIADALAEVTQAQAQATSIYKDANIRNWIVRPDGSYVAVDFESVTAAPPGYDLAKLLVSAHLTWGVIHEFDAIVDLYCSIAAQADRERVTSQIHLWCEIHWLLTAAYAGLNGYRHFWPDVRPPSITPESISH